MKCNTYTGIVLATAGALSILSATAQETPEGEVAAVPAANYTPSRMIEMRPSDKTPLMVKANERNPYARRSVEEENTNDAGENAEEIQIRQRLSSLSVSGKSVGPNGLRILLGDIILEQGRHLPQLLPNQVEALKVVEVSESSIILGWLDVETNKLTGKTMQVGYDLTPKITFALQGQPTTNSADGEPAERQLGVMRIRNRDELDPNSNIASQSSDFSGGQ